MTTTISKKTTVTINLNETEMIAIHKVAELFYQFAMIVSNNYSDEICRIWDVDNDVPIKVRSDELNTIAMNIEEFLATKSIKLLPAD